MLSRERLPLARPSDGRTMEWAFVHRILKVKQSRNRPGVVQRVPGGLGSKIFMIFGTWRWWGCQPHAPAAFTPKKCSWYSFSLGAESTPGPWNCRKEYVTKNPVTPPGIDLGTIRLVAQRLNHYATPGLCFKGSAPKLMYSLVYTDTIIRT